MCFLHRAVLAVLFEVDVVLQNAVSGFKYPGGSGDVVILQLSGIQKRKFFELALVSGIDRVLDGVIPIHVLPTRLGYRWLRHEQSPRRAAQGNAVASCCPSGLVGASVVVDVRALREAIADSNRRRAGHLGEIT